MVLLRLRNAPGWRSKTWRSGESLKGVRLRNSHKHGAKLAQGLSGGCQHAVISLCADHEVREICIASLLGCDLRGSPPCSGALEECRLSWEWTSGGHAANVLACAL